MRVSVLYFAILRERLRCEQESIELPAGATVAEGLATIAARHPGIAGLLPQVQTAVNRQMAVGTHALAEGDELALLPPVAGGADAAGGGAANDAGPAPPARRKIAVLGRALSLGAVVAEVEGVERGGIVTFTGVVRRHGRHGEVVRLEYEAYVEMAEQVLTEIAEEIEREWPGVHVAIHHRVGSLLVGETAVVIAAAAPHRAEAFDACEAAIDRLKRRAPIWKKEIGTHGEEWIGHCP
ncbi:MAG TPA: molybdenum cofactor biosynthesis protein MoaE [Polyangia bacterium]|jgi:molybdopterin synthase catalytic subunit|nr:molybdenum cofactor biosynthesis protein MoaE [Polyangia bacterium]